MWTYKLKWSFSCLKNYSLLDKVWEGIFLIIRMGSGGIYSGLSTLYCKEMNTLFWVLTCQSLEWLIHICNTKFVTHALHSNIGVFYPWGTYKTTSAIRAYSATPVKVILVLPEDPKPLYLRIQPTLFSLIQPLSFDTKPNAVNLAYAKVSQAKRRCLAVGSCSPHFLQLICQW